jgi:WD40 repeat protein
MVMTPDGKVLVTCGEREGLIRVRDARTGEGLATISSWGGCLAVSPDGKTPVRGRTGSG